MEIVRLPLPDVELPERLTPFGIMGAHLKPPVHHGNTLSRALRGPSIGPPLRLFLSDGRWWRIPVCIFFNYVYTQRNIFQISLNQTEIRFCLPFSVWFGTKRTLSVWFQINWKIVNTIWFRFDLRRFRKYFSVCRSALCTYFPVFCSLFFSFF